MLKQITENVFLFEDTCFVYIIRNHDQAVLVDFGSGEVCKELAGLGIKKVEAVLLTHHHRDQLQGLSGTEERFPVYVPHAERELIEEADVMWQGREILNNYNCRQDRYSPLADIPVSGSLLDYAEYIFAGIKVRVWPTPGHTTGSVTLEMTVDGQKLAFTGDLIFDKGKVVSLAATQWTYNGGEGLPYTVLSLLFLKDQHFDYLLPSHGKVMRPDETIPETVDNLGALMKLRRQNPRCFQLRERPYEQITEHLLFNRTSMSDSYVLLSKSGKALILDLGYDFMAGVAAGTDRSSRRPWLYTIPWLFDHYGVTTIDACIPTHYHDDHVAGFSLLQRRYGTKVMCAESFADIISHPADYDLPCLWYDPIKVDQVLPLNQPFMWEEYELTLYPMSGHTQYETAISFTVDGKQVLCTGDQYADEDGLFCNYVYKNRFSYHDFVESAALYRKLSPDLILTGHWQFKERGKDYPDRLEERGRELARLHEKLLPEPAAGFDPDQRLVSCRPYQVFARQGEEKKLVISVTNPYAKAIQASVFLVLPEGVSVAGGKEFELSMDAGETKEIQIPLQVTVKKARRLRIGIDLVMDGIKIGQAAEALLTSM